MIILRSNRYSITGQTEEELEEFYGNKENKPDDISDENWNACRDDDLADAVDNKRKSKKLKPNKVKRKKENDNITTKEL